MERRRSFGVDALRIGIVICGFAVILALALGSILVAVPVFLCPFAAILLGAAVSPPSPDPASPARGNSSRSRAPPSD